MLICSLVFSVVISIFRKCHLGNFPQDISEIKCIYKSSKIKRKFCLKTYFNNQYASSGWFCDIFWLNVNGRMNSHKTYCSKKSKPQLPDWWDMVGKSLLDVIFKDFTSKYRKKRRISLIKSWNLWPMKCECTWFIQYLNAWKLRL